jgi:hypothetical protein
MNRLDLEKNTATLLRKMPMQGKRDLGTIAPTESQAPQVSFWPLGIPT